MKFRPCIDLHQGKVRQIIGGTYSDRASDVTVNYTAEEGPAHFARLYRADDLPGGHVIMLGPGNEEAARQALQAYPRGLMVGGGINADNAGDWLDAGAEKVIVTSSVFTDNHFDLAKLKDLSERVGRERLVLDLSCRRRENFYLVVKDKWQTWTDMEVSAAGLDQYAEYVSEFLVHGVDSEGKKAGIEKDLLKILARSSVPVVYAGGIANMADINEIEDKGHGKVDFTVGSALDIFGGSGLKYKDMLKYR